MLRNNNTNVINEIKTKMKISKENYEIKNIKKNNKINELKTNGNTQDKYVFRFAG